MFDKLKALFSPNALDPEAIANHRYRIEREKQDAHELPARVAIERLAAQLHSSKPESWVATGKKDLEYQMSFDSGATAKLSRTSGEHGVGSGDERTMERWYGHELHVADNTKDLRVYKSDDGDNATVKLCLGQLPEGRWAERFEFQDRTLCLSKLWSHVRDSTHHASLRAQRDQPKLEAQRRKELELEAARMKGKAELDNLKSGW